MQCIKGIYIITNIINKKQYIGSSTDIRIRWRNHLKGLKHNEHKNIAMQSDYNKYGKDAFIFEILDDDCDNLNRKQLRQLEDEYIDFYKTIEKGYNIRKNSTFKHTIESKQKMSCIMKEKLKNGIPEERKQRISETLKGSIPGNKVKPEVEQYIKQLLIENKHVNDIRSETGVGRSVIYKFKQQLIKDGIIPDEPKNKIPLRIENEIKELLMNNITVDNICKELKIGYSSVYKFKQQLIQEGKIK